MQKAISTLKRCNTGSSLIELALLMPFLMLLLIGAVDLGRAYYVAIEVSDAAHAGALYGVQNPLDAPGMIAAATLDAVNVPSVIPTATYGCECPDNNSSAVVSCSAVPSCTLNVVNYVQVSTTAQYFPLLKYPGIPSPIVMNGRARMRSAH